MVFGLIIGGRRVSVGREFVDATPDGMLDHLQTRVVQLLDQAEGGGEKV